MAADCRCANIYTEPKNEGVNFLREDVYNEIYIVLKMDTGYIGATFGPIKYCPFCGRKF